MDESAVEIYQNQKGAAIDEAMIVRSFRGLAII